MSSLIYRDGDGVRHKVIVSRTPTGDWQVLDSCGRGTSVIEVLEASEDDRPGRGGGPRLRLERRTLRGAGGARRRAGHT